MYINRPIASEFLARHHGDSGNHSVEESARISAEVEVVVCLLKAGCPFYSVRNSSYRKYTLIMKTIATDVYLRVYMNEYLCILYM
jgi:hypothetical protein